MRVFELFLEENKVTASDWQRMVFGISEYEGNFTLEVEFGTNKIEFYIYAQKDLSLLATKLEGFILKPTVRQPVTSENNLRYKKIGFKLAPKNILEQREAEEIKRQRIIHRVTVNFRKIFTINVHFVTVFLKDVKEGDVYSSYCSLTNPLLNFEFDFSNNVKLKKKSVPLYLKIDDAANLFTHSEQGAFLEVFGFPYFSNPTYFPLEKFEFGKHSLIVGQTGVGKSKFIELLVKNIAKYSAQDEYSVVIIDPHASLYSQFLAMEQAKLNFDFIRNSCDLFPPFSEPKVATELTILLFKTLLKDQFNAKMERVLKYSVYLLFLQNKMSLIALKKFLTELEFRKEVLSSLREEGEHLGHFFETEFVEMQTKFYEIAIMPILVLIDELSFIPAFFNNVSSYSIEEALKNNFLLTFSLNRIFLGEKATRLIAGLIIQQLFLIAQKGSVGKKIILIIDEVSIVENESLINILSEARKFNLSLFLSQQYLTQIMPELLKGILSNVYNYFVFKVSDEDAKILAKNLDITFPDEILIKQKEKGFSDEDLKRNLLVNLNPRECLVRPFADGKFYSCFKARTMPIN
ncbi:DUF87 domain-containing protein [Patescibacteria group bacterium]|nr:DUF87 domain-containing protein [Patescibacteria group bacterium]